MQQSLLPFQCRGDDGVEIIEPGAPARLNVDPATDIPFGFYDRPGFEQFSRRLYEPLRAVDKDAQLVLEGSGVTGRRFDRLISHEPTGAPFGVGRAVAEIVAVLRLRFATRTCAQDDRQSPSPMLIGEASATRPGSL